MLQVADETQAADTHDYAEEEQQRIPLDTRHLPEAVKCSHVTGFSVDRHIGRRGFVGNAQVVTEELEVRETRHHSQEGGQVKEVVE